MRRRIHAHEARAGVRLRHAGKHAALALGSLQPRDRWRQPPDDRSRHWAKCTSMLFARLGIDDVETAMRDRQARQARISGLWLRQRSLVSESDTSRHVE